MGFTQFSQPVQPVDTFQPLPLDQILQGAKAVYDRGEQNFQKVQGLINAAYAIPSLPGKDTEVKNKKMQEYMANIQELAKGNLSDPRIANQIQGYISTIAQDPDILSVAERATAYTNELKAKKEAEAKGRKYISPILDQATDYINQNTYIRDTKFNEQGFVSPDISKYATEAVKMTPPIKQFKYDPKTGQYTEVTSVDSKRLSENFSLLAAQDPSVEKLLRYNFKNKYKDVDWSTQGELKLQQDLEALKQNILFAKANGMDTTPYEEVYSSYLELQNNPSLLSIPMEDRYFQLEKESYFNNALKGAAYVSEGMPELSDLGKMNRQFAQQKELLFIKEQQKQAQKKQIEDKVKNSVLQAAYKRAMDLGFDVFDSQRNLVPEEVLNSYGLGKPVKETEEDKTKVLLGEKEFTKSNVVQGILSGNKDITQLFIQTYKDKLPGGLEEGDEDIKIEGDNILYEQSGGTGNITGYDKSVNKYRFIADVYGFKTKTGEDVVGLEQLTDEQLKELYNLGEIIVK